MTKQSDGSRLPRQYCLLLSGDGAILGASDSLSELRNAASPYADHCKLPDFGLPPALANAWDAAVTRMNGGHTQALPPVRFEFDGKAFLLDTVLSRLTAADGDMRILITAQDGTESELRTELDVSKARLATALKVSRLGLWDWDLDSGHIYYDARCCEMLGYDPAGGIANDGIGGLGKLIHADDEERANQLIHDHLCGKTPPYTLDWRARCADGTYKWLRSTGQVTCRDADGKPHGVAGTVRDISDQKQLGHQLAQSEQNLKQILDSAHDGLIGLSADGRCHFANPGACSILQCRADELVGQPLGQVLAVMDNEGRRIEDSSLLPVVPHASLAPRRAREANFQVLPHAAVAVDYSVSPVMVDGECTGNVLSFRDARAQREVVRELTEQAFNDPLTGAVNRRGFEAKIDTLLCATGQSSGPSSIVFVDLTFFKVINDTCGHLAGDQLLRELTAAFSLACDKLGTLARVGGDEFAVLLPGADLASAEDVAYALRSIVSDFRFAWGGCEFAIAASFGVAAIDQRQPSASAALLAADAACRVAKATGPTEVYVAHPHDMAVSRLQNEIRWVPRLTDALNNGRFELFVQHIVRADAPSEPADHHEILLRLLGDDDKPIAPAQFMGAAEHFRLIAAIDRWVLRTLFERLEQELETNPGIRKHCFGVNLSSQTLLSGNLISDISALISKHRIPPAMIYFEITETAAIANLSAAVQLMRELRNMGFKLALDDFGSGCSSFRYLKAMPVNIVKIDGSFVRDVLKNPVDREIVESIRGVAARMELQTVAEFVETPEICECMASIGVTFAQGYAFSIPKPLTEMLGANSTTSPKLDGTLGLSPA